MSLGFPGACHTHPVSSQIGAMADTISKKALVMLAVPVDRTACSQKNSQSCSPAADIMAPPPRLCAKLYSCASSVSRPFVRLDEPSPSPRILKRVTKPEGALYRNYDALAIIPRKSETNNPLFLVPTPSVPQVSSKRRKRTSRRYKSFLRTPSAPPRSSTSGSNRSACTRISSGCKDRASRVPFPAPNRIACIRRTAPPDRERHSN